MNNFKWTFILSIMLLSKICFADDIAKSFYIGMTSSHWDFKQLDAVLPPPTTGKGEVFGDLSVLGLDAGAIYIREKAFGFDSHISLLKTISQSFSTEVDWRHQWFGRISGNVNYGFFNNFFGFAGLNILASLNQSSDSEHYGLFGTQLGLGCVLNSFLIQSYYETNKNLSFGFSEQNKFRGYGLSLSYLL